jgi:hypothetical protein
VLQHVNSGTFFLTGEASGRTNPNGLNQSDNYTQRREGTSMSLKEIVSYLTFSNA